MKQHQASAFRRYGQYLLAIAAGGAISVFGNMQATAQVANEPLFLTGTGLPPNILFIPDTSESMQEGLSLGRVALDWDDPDCAPGPDLDPHECAAGARHAESKASIVKRIGLSLVDEYRNQINLGLLSYQQNPAGDNRDDVFEFTDPDRTVLWRLTHRPGDLRFAPVANPGFFDPDFDGPLTSDTKRFREPHPTVDGWWVFYNYAAPGYHYETSESGIPEEDRTTFAYLENPNELHPYWMWSGMTSSAVGGDRVDPDSGLYFADRYGGAWRITLTDSMRQRGIPDWGTRVLFSQLNQLEWRSNTSPGKGYLHVPISGLDGDGNPVPDHWEAIEAKLQPQRHDWDQTGDPMTDPDWPLIAAGLTPLEGTMRTARDYFVEFLEERDDVQGAPDGYFGADQGRTPDVPQIPASCGVNAAIWVTDGLPTVGADGELLGEDIPSALQQAEDAVARFHDDAGADVYVVGFALPPGVADIDGVPDDPLSNLAAAGGTGQAFQAVDEDSLDAAMSQIFSSIIAEATGSAASVAANSTTLQAGSAVFAAGFDSSDWSGSFQAFRVTVPEVADDDLVDSDPGWDAEAMLPAAAARNIFTWVPDSSGGPGPAWARGATELFRSDRLGDLATEQQAFLDGADGRGAERLDWLRGDQTHEGHGAGEFRVRSGLIGDIVYSQPLFVHAQNFGYHDLESGGSSYQDALDDWKEAPPLVMVGANDGKLHAFDGRLPCLAEEDPAVSGCSDLGGREIFAFVPNAVYRHFEDLSDPAYARRYVLDGSPRLGHVHDGAGWRRIVVASLGRGGKGVFAIDIDSREVLWELDADHSDRLGYVIGDPSLGRSASGDWITIIPNGYDSDEGQAGLLILDTLTGETLKEWFPGNNDGDNDSDNGMFTPVPVDLDGDRRIDRIYAGDLRGNLWRLDLEGGPANWRAPGHLRQGQNQYPLFRASHPDGGLQPITSRPAVARDEDGVLHLLFGTGSYFTVQDGDLGSATVQSMYGIRDDGGATVERGELLQQEIVHELESFGYELRVTSDHPPSADDRGWVMDLLSPNAGFEGERVVEDAMVRHGDRVVFATLTPEVGDDPCATGGGTGWIMEFDAFTGGRLERSPWDLSGDGFGEESFVDVPGLGSVPAHGIRSPVGIPSRPTVIEDVNRRDREYKLPMGTDGDLWEMPDEERPGFIGRSWRQLR